MERKQAMLMVYLTKELKIAFKLYCVKNGLIMTAVVQKLISNLINEKK